MARGGDGGRIRPPEGRRVPAGHVGRGEDAELLSARLRQASETDAGRVVGRRLHRDLGRRCGGGRSVGATGGGGRARHRLDGHQRRGRRLAVARRQRRLFWVARRVEVLRPLGFQVAAQLLPADGEQGQGGVAVQPAKGFGVFRGVDGFLGVRNAARAEQVASAVAGRAVLAGVQHHRVPRRDLTQLERQLGAAGGRPGAAGTGLRARVRGGRGLVGEGDAAVGADDAVDALGRGGQCGQQAGGGEGGGNDPLHVAHSLLSWSAGSAVVQAMPWCRSRASIDGSRPRKALNDSIAGRLPPASRID